MRHADLKHVIFETEKKIALISTPVTGEQNIYEWTAGQLQLVNVLPDGDVAPDGMFGDEGENGQSRNAISNDGTRVMWSEGGNLYMRDTASAETVQLNVPEAGAEGRNYPAIYQTASADGTKVFFTDEARLTSDSTAGGEHGGADLYVFEVNGGGGPLAGKLTDLTVHQNAHEAAAVQGLVMGAAEDGSDVYFVADGVLASGASAGAPNLYVEDYDSEQARWEEPRLVAVLSPEDAPDWNGDKGFNLGYMTSRVSPNGRYLAFMSDRELTGYDNLDVNSGQRDEEVYLYDASAGRLVCASCNPSGARPVGVFDPENAVGIEPLLVDQRGTWTQRWLAASVPGWTELDVAHSLYQSRYLSDEGRLFFDSTDALVPQDTNGKEDVYEYEPEGLGSCQSSSPTFSNQSGGCVALISSGTSIEESAFLDASANGDDVFFLTTSKLVSQDYDTAFDVYDAHVCTSVAPCYPPPPVTPPPCITGESCKAAPSPQPGVFGPSGSATFSGAGNVTAAKPVTVKPKTLTRAQKLAKALAACTKKQKKKRAGCVKRAERMYDSKPRSKPTNSKARKSVNAGQRSQGR